eukprot:CAMPEP_0172488194 /NCGR_PEP_ID=MMETSP1066-20121228/17607_1 /TAXON_ID=671091 /ORGANISM="Coscinodiscus wailesii, Strain CCMP2513" /LENGTH=341 /DNA_ID=CAMNT_0013255265 /DNA_START=6 /DNA_END=1031 /DNA_ORIENTATION=-
MSKSLKNFVTVREYWARQEERGSGSPGDDFRLWCLGLSGRYRGSATFSFESLEEALNIRTQIVQFLMDAEEILTKGKDDKSHNCVWSQHDLQLFQSILNARRNCHEALLNDLDGATFLKQLLQIIKITKPHLRTSINAAHTILPNITAIVRELLSVVGFTDATVHAGRRQRHLLSSLNDNDGNTNATKNAIDELVSFRSRVRRHGLRNKDESLLELCDDVRAATAAKGVEIQDIGGGGGGGGSSEDTSTTTTTPSWRFCVPKQTPPLSAVSSSKRRQSPSPPLRPETVSFMEYFQVGVYEGQFKEFDDETGLPVTHVDGREVSNNLKKKLIKKRDKFFKSR